MATACEREIYVKGPLFPARRPKSKTDEEGAAASGDIKARERRFTCFHFGAGVFQPSEAGSVIVSEGGGGLGGKP